MAEVPARSTTLFEKPTNAHVVTITSDGNPYATPVWIDYDATASRLLVNTERGHRKERNVAEDQTVAVSTVAPENS